MLGPVAIVIATGLFTFSNVFAQGEHSRRVAAELTIIAGDINKLQLGGLPPQHAVGLRKRIKGSLIGLDILARLADQEQGLFPVSRHALIKTMYSDLDNDRINELYLAISELLNEYPLQLPSIKVNETSPFGELHSQLCSACHDYPDQRVERPAYNLSEQTRNTDPTEMFARMLVGVRGDRTTGIDNPLSDLQIVGLLTYYRNLDQTDSTGH